MEEERDQKYEFGHDAPDAGEYEAGRGGAYQDYQHFEGEDSEGGGYDQYVSNGDESSAEDNDFYTDRRFQAKQENRGASMGKEGASSLSIQRENVNQDPHNFIPASYGLDLQLPPLTLREPTGPIRKGKWSKEEEAYTSRIISDFNKGLLGLPPGTTLRSFLSLKLNCDPMRVTKKFSGSACIGKRVFQPCKLTPEVIAEIHRSRQDLQEMESRFFSRLDTKEEGGRGADDSEYVPMTQHDGRPPLAMRSEMRPMSGGRVSDNDAGLLLDFFKSVHRRSEELVANEELGQSTHSLAGKRCMSTPVLSALAQTSDAQIQVSHPPKRQKSLENLESFYHQQS